MALVMREIQQYEYDVPGRSKNKNYGNASFGIHQAVATLYLAFLMGSRER